jgi:His/Glu/Gln/Arg/opine family amino acid ABC transporter permease subunit
MRYIFQFGQVLEQSGVFLSGLRFTLLLGLSAGILGVILAWGVALLRGSSKPSVRLISGAYIEFWRNTPLIVQVFFVYFGLTSLTGLSLSAVQAGFVAILLNTTSYYAEIVRAGLQAIPKVQLEAAAAVGLTNVQILRLVTIPLTMKTVFPALVNQFVLTVLGTSILAIIGTPDLLYRANAYQAVSGRTIETYLVTALIYVVLILGFSVILKVVEERFFKLPELQRVQGGRRSA